MDKDNSREIQFKEELVRKAKNGDTKAFSLLYAGVCKEMYKFALYMMKHTEDAEDAVSETVISAFENIAKLKKDVYKRQGHWPIISGIEEEHFHASTGRYQ